MQSNFHQPKHERLQSYLSENLSYLLVLLSPLVENLQRLFRFRRSHLHRVMEEVIKAGTWRLHH